MALFTKKTEEKKSGSDIAPKKKKPAVSGGSTRSSNADLSRVLLAPRVTEKASFTADAGAYIFNIDPRTTKEEVKKAVRKIYNVHPIKIAIIPIPAKKVFSRKGGHGVKSGGKKAVVYLKKGETIEIV